MKDQSSKEPAAKDPNAEESKDEEPHDQFYGKHAGFETRCSYRAEEKPGVVGEGCHRERLQTDWRLNQKFEKD